MKIVVNKENDNKRIDKFLCEVIDESRSVIQRNIKNGLVTVNDNVVSSNYKLKEEDVIVVEEFKKADTNIEPQDIKLDIVYEDDYLVVVNKPSGMVVHPAPGNYRDTLVNALLFYFNNLSDINGEYRPGIVHRIDKDTSGLLVVAKDNKVHEMLSQMIQNKEVKREYIAIVHGILNEEIGEIIAPIGRDVNDRKKMDVTSKNSKHAKTNFTVLRRYKDYSVVQCELETGRTHQIRVHFKYIEHPIFGDPLYGPKKSVIDFGQALHSKKLSFTHPITKEFLSFEVEEPQEFKDIEADIIGDKCNNQ